MYRLARGARIYDGADEVHRQTVARLVLRDYQAARLGVPERPYPKPPRSRPQALRGAARVGSRQRLDRRPSRQLPALAPLSGPHNPGLTAAAKGTAENQTRHRSRLTHWTHLQRNDGNDKQPHQDQPAGMLAGLVAVFAFGATTAGIFTSFGHAHRTFLSLRGR